MWTRLPGSVRYLSQKSPEWEHARKQVAMTASVAPDIMGVGYNSLAKAYEKHRGINNDEPTQFLKDMWARGKEDEDKVVQLFTDWVAHEYATKAGDRFIIEETGLWQHEKYLWLAASPDRRLYHDNMITILEAKSRQGGGDAMMPSLGHYVQMQVQLACVPTAQFCWYASANVRLKVEIPFMVSTVHYDQKLFEDVIRPRLEQFIDPAYRPGRASKCKAIDQSYAQYVTQLYPPVQ